MSANNVPLAVEWEPELPLSEERHADDESLFENTQSDQSLGATIEATPAFPLPVELFADIRSQLEGRWLVKGFLSTDAFCVMFGAPSAGKSFLAIDLGLHVAAKRPWLGRPVKGGGVVYIAAEGQAGVRMRIEAWKRQYQPTDDLPFALIPVALDLLRLPSERKRIAETLALLSRLWDGISLVIIDTLAATFGGGDENGSDMQTYVSNVSLLCEPFGCAKLIVAHVPVSEVGKPRPRGHGSLLASADTALLVAESKSLRSISVVKQKDDDPGNPIFFDLTPVEIGDDEDGFAISSCVVALATSSIATQKNGRALAGREKTALNLLLDLVQSSGTPPPDDISDRCKAVRAANLSTWKEAVIAALVAQDMKRDSARKGFERARDRLVAEEIVEIYGEWVWTRL